jgi:2-(1,2-epoxy-1,2-dihydrophenyl)acetyl-CoA isomerase
MSFETILFDVQGGVARVTLNRPDRLNAFTVQMHEELNEALASLAGGEARVLVLTGAGRAFCAGQDLSDRAVAPAGDNVDLGESLELRYNPLIRRLVGLPMPVVAAVNGVAAGAGANIALAADIVIAAKGARFIQSFANIGLLPDSGGTWVLPRLVGQARAMGLALTGEPLSAEKAEAWGLIWKVVEDSDLAAETDALAAKLAIAPTRGLVATRRALRESWTRPLSQALDHERDEQRALGRSHDYAEGVAAFLAKRPAAFKGE